MTQEDRDEFSRQLKGVQALAKHLKTTITGLEWKDGHLRGLFAVKDEVEPEPEGPVFVEKPKRKRASPTQLDLL